MKLASLVLLAGACACAQTVETVEVQPRSLDRTLKIPGELLPFESVELHARVQGYVERIDVDRGSAVRKGQVIARLSAPEMVSQVAEAESRVHQAEAEVAEADARVAGAESVYNRLKAASETPGAVAGVELVRAEKEVEAARALVVAKRRNVDAARAALAAVRKLEAYLAVTAPFSGTITERLVHPGALVGPATGPLVRLEQLTRLRLVVPVPEAVAGAAAVGQRVTFTVPAQPGEAFPATVARMSGALDPKTRTMAVELDVSNPRNRLAPGMYPEVVWPVRKSSALLVPASAVATSTERTFVIRVANGRAEYVNVRKGNVTGDQVEIFGPLVAGDRIVKRASDEIREGIVLKVR